MARTKKGQEHTPKNVATADEVLEIIEGIEEQKSGLVDLHMTYMGECKPFHERIKELIDRGVKVYGMGRRSIQAKVKQRDYERKAEAQRAKLDDEEVAAFDKLSEQLGELGKAAKASFYKADPLAGFSGAT
jgi:hypothetical protein